LTDTLFAKKENRVKISIVRKALFKGVEINDGNNTESILDKVIERERMILSASVAGVSSKGEMTINFSDKIAPLNLTYINSTVI
jgi:hypothetical protein